VVQLSAFFDWAAGAEKAESNRRRFGVVEAPRGFFPRTRTEECGNGTARGTINHLFESALVAADSPVSGRVSGGRAGSRACRPASVGCASNGGRRGGTAHSKDASRRRRLAGPGTAKSRGRQTAPVQDDWGETRLGARARCRARRSRVGSSPTLARRCAARASTLSRAHRRRRRERGLRAPRRGRDFSAGRAFEPQDPIGASGRTRRLGAGACRAHGEGPRSILGFSRGSWWAAVSRRASEGERTPALPEGRCASRTQGRRKEHT